MSTSTRLLTVWLAVTGLLPVPLARGQIQVAFDAYPRIGVAPLSVSFHDTSAVSQPTAWLWDFGDGQTSTAASPTHAFLQPGSYSVTLTV